MLFIIRPMLQALETKKILEEKGVCNVSILNLLDIHYETKAIKQVIETYQNFDSVVVTSVQALLALETIKDDFSDFSGKIYCVGQKTALIAKNLGFRNIFFPQIENANGMIKELFQKSSETILYLTTEDAKCTLEAYFIKGDFSYKRYNIYKMVENPLQPSEIDALSRADSVQLLCFSYRAYKLTKKQIESVILTNAQEKMIFWHIVSCEEREKMVNIGKNVEVEYYDSPNILYQSFLR